MIRAAIKGIEYYLPAQTVTNAELAAEFPEWSVDKIEAKTGIVVRHIAGPDECSSDLAVAAAQKLLASGVCTQEEVDYLILCTQSPDYFLPATACLIQDRLGIPRTCGAIDFNQGCSGFVYGLGLSKGLIESGQARRVLLLTAETYSKFIHPADKSVRTIFGDAAAATLIEGVAGNDGPSEEYLGPFVYGTDGKGAENLIVPKGGMRQRQVHSAPEPGQDRFGNVRTAENLYMNGSEIFNFTLQTVPESVQTLLEISGKTLDQIDLFVFHQANRHMLEHLRKKLKIAPERFCVAMCHCGNTVSSTIPIAIRHAWTEGRIKRGDTLLLVGFGVGYSWAATLVRWV